MTLFGQMQARRSRNAEAFARLGVEVGEGGTVFREVRSGSTGTIFTIGYERRSLEDLIAHLRDAGVTRLVDVRERPMSRKPDFRKNILAAACEQAGIAYESWPRLGSTAAQREKLKTTGDVSHFMSRFRDFARRGRRAELEALSHLAQREPIALLCYERAHDECHRAVVADLTAEQTDASIVAIA